MGIAPIAGLDTNSGESMTIKFRLFKLGFWLYRHGLKKLGIILGGPYFGPMLKPLAQSLMDSEKHRRRHEMLHKHLDELLADFIMATGKRPSETSIFELLEWSHAQTKEGVSGLNEGKASGPS